jgi:hypothetical protein
MEIVVSCHVLLLLRLVMLCLVLLCLVMLCLVMNLLMNWSVPYNERLWINIGMILKIYVLRTIFELG